MESHTVGKKQCPRCAENGNDTSHDNLVMYSDGHGYCFACEYYHKGDSMNTYAGKKEESKFKTLQGVYTNINERGLTEKACRTYGYGVANINGKDVHIANYYSNNKLVAQHLRGPNKQFHWTGTPRGCELFGQHLWKDKGGRRVIVTEGEVDCLTVYQLMGYTYPVVSLTNGAANAVKDVKNNLEFLSSYNEIIIMFDQDDAGKEAAKAVAELLPVGKCKIATLPFKDANECLMKNNSKAVVTASWEAKTYSPDEILHVSNLPDLSDTESDVWAFPFDKLTDFLVGQRSGEITLWASGTGSGKSTLLRELMIHHLSENRSVGAIMLEESPQETMDDLISLMINKPVRPIRAARTMNQLRKKMNKSPIHVDIIDDLTDEEYADARSKLCESSLYIYDHLGNNAMKNLLARMEYMAVSLGVDVIVLDHITAAAAGLVALGHNKDVEGGSSERIIIDTLMKELRALSVRTGVHVDIVSQLKKTDKSYEEGSRITLQDLRGSGALASVPNTVIALERDRQNADSTVANTTIVRVLKNRLTGKSGVACCLHYDHNSGRMREVEFGIQDGNISLADNPFKGT